MHELLAKARQVAAAEKTATGIESLHEKVDRVLALLGDKKDEPTPPEPAPAEEPAPKAADEADDESAKSAHRKARK